MADSVETAHPLDSRWHVGTAAAGGASRRRRRRRAGLGDQDRLVGRPRSPARCWCSPGVERPHWGLRRVTRFRTVEPGDHALGRCRGGLSTKVHLAVDGRGLPLSIVLTGGQAGDNPQLLPVLDGIAVPGLISGVRGSARSMSSRTRPTHTRPPKRRCGAGASGTIPEKTDQEQRRAGKGRRGGRPRAFPERPTSTATSSSMLHPRLEQWRGVATRYDKRADNCCGGCARQCARQRRLERASRGLARAWRTAGPARCGAAGHGQAGGSWLYRGACRRPRKPRPDVKDIGGCGLGCVAEGADPSVWICSSPECSRSSPAVTALSESSDLRVVLMG